MWGPDADPDPGPGSFDTSRRVINNGERIAVVEGVAVNTLRPHYNSTSPHRQFIIPANEESITCATKKLTHTNLHTSFSTNLTYDYYYFKLFVFFRGRNLVV